MLDLYKMFLLTGILADTLVQTTELESALTHGRVKICSVVHSAELDSVLPPKCGVTSGRISWEIQNHVCQIQNKRTDRNLRSMSRKTDFL
jgi:hypothetical protein